MKKKQLFNSKKKEMLTNEKLVNLKETDERYRYLLKYGTVKQVISFGNTIFVELP